MLPTDIFNEIRETLEARESLGERYRRLYLLLGEVCVASPLAPVADFSGLFSRLYAVCKVHGIEHHAIDRFRRTARLASQGKVEVPLSEETLRADAAVLAHFVSQIFGTSAPRELSLHDRGITPYGRGVIPERVECLRAIVTAVRADSFVCTSVLGDLEVRVPHLLRTLAVLHEGHAVNLIDFSHTGEGQGWAHAVILDPDYMIDVSALTATVREYGEEAANYLLGLLAPRRVTSAMLLGEAANQFMDTLVNVSAVPDDEEALESLYRRALRRHFADHVLSYVGMAEDLKRDYFDRLHETFLNIARSVRRQFPASEVGMPPGEILLEPSFVCEPLGLRGRLDLMRADYRCLIELKSGRAEDFGVRQVRPRTPHVLQMSLYKEMLHFCRALPRDAVSTFLFYSRYPAFFNERSSAQAVSDVLELRNEIVALEERLRQGDCENVLALLTPERLNRKGLRGKFWENYLRPSIAEVSDPLAQADPLTRLYFCRFLAFAEAEKYLGKTTDLRPESNRGQAAAWTADVQSKIQSGDILVGLRLLVLEGEDGVERLTFALPRPGEDFVPNFSVGEMVQLYQRNAPSDNVTNALLTRAYVEEITAETLTLRLAFKQRNPEKLFPLSASYAVEHDGSDAPSRLALRGLFSLLTAEPSRRDLLLARRRPAVSAAPPSLLGRYPEAVEDVVKAAYAADDYFLLVGPPGTGKTSVALRALVEEFLLRHAAAPEAGVAREGLLLMAYTNRAVDEICEMLLRIGAPFIRLGSEQTGSAETRPYLFRNALADCPTRAAATARILETPIIVGTVTTLNSHTALFRLRPFMAIVDEASQVLEPQLLGLLCARRPDGRNGIGRFILVGDHRQLPAVVLLPPNRTVVSDPELRAIGLTDLRNSLFQRLHTLCLERGWDNVTAMLRRTGRMHEDICRFAAAAFYADRLTTVPLSHQKEILPRLESSDAYERFVAESRMGFIDVQPATQPPMPRVNAAEAAEAARLLVTLVRQHEAAGRPLDVARQVGIIVPFRAQIAQTRRALRAAGIADADRLTIDTVECFQGSQRDIIVFCTVVSRPRQLSLLSEEFAVEGGAIDRKLNVALTRARLRFFLIGNAALLGRSPIYARLMGACAVEVG